MRSQTDNESSAADLVALGGECGERFAARFGRAPEWLVAAPGRVNLIGEHVDYNDGLVLPLAIERWIVIAGAGNGSRAVRVASGGEDAGEEPVAIALDGLPVRSAPVWSNYVRGVIAGFLRRGIALPGFDAEIHSSVPKGGGLSSSAALEVAVATLIECAAGVRIPAREKAMLCQAAEHEFARVPCGIMDQFASALALRGRLLLLDCRSLEVEHVPFESEDVSVLIANTHVSRALVDGGYAERRAQCEAAAESLVRGSLRDVTPAELESAKLRMDDRIYRRARHVVTEIERTHQAVDAIKRKDWERCGELMFASHTSLRNDYEVSCPELDAFVEIARAIGVDGGVYGCRMTGAGFGGCTVSLVRADRAAAIAAAYSDEYRRATGIEPAIFSTRAAEGAQVLTPLMNKEAAL